jgi:flagellar assembly protein FliH
MGKVVKGARLIRNAYQLGLPAIGEAPKSAQGFALDAEALAYPDEVLQAADIDMDGARAEAARLIDDATADAERLLSDARERALQLVDDAQSGVDELHAAAKAEGFERGVSDGRTAAQAEMDEMLETMRGLVEMARLERHKIIQAAEPEIVRIAVAVCERILNAHLALEPAAVVEMVRAAISRVVTRETVTVRVNPADLEIMRENREGLMAMNDIDNMRLIEDQRVDRGGVVIDTDAGTIDAKISTQLREARRLLAVEEPVTVPPSNEPPIINATAQAS